MKGSGRADRCQGLAVSTMRLGVPFVLLAVGLGRLAGVLGGLGSIPVWYAAASFLVVGAAYLGGTARPLGKGSNGSLGVGSRAVLLPYLLLQGVVYRLSRSRSFPVTEVAPGVFLGPRLLASEVAILEAHSIAAILDLTCEFSEPGAVMAGRRYHCIPLLDGMPPRPDELGEAVDFVSRNHPVYIHCAQGHGRSASVVLAWLVSAGIAPTLAEARARLARVRPRARPSRRQLLAVQAFLEPPPRS